MKQLKVECAVSVYDSELEIKMKNHENNNNLIVLEVQGKEYIVNAREVQKSLENCTNTRII